MTRGEIAYNAYCQRRGWKSIRGEQLPPFIRQSQELMDAWEDAAKAIVGEVRSTQDLINSLYREIADLKRKINENRPKASR